MSELARLGGRAAIACTAGDELQPVRDLPRREVVAARPRLPLPGLELRRALETAGAACLLTRQRLGEAMRCVAVGRTAQPSLTPVWLLAIPPSSDDLATD